ncbi:MAG: DUF6438 domain-containing protein [Gemmatimonadaceae bacterium]
MIGKSSSSAALRVVALVALGAHLSSCSRGAQSRAIDSSAAAAPAPSAAPPAAVQQPSEPPATSAPSPARASTLAEITLERGPCLGMCPVYKVVLKGDGTVVFEGKQGVDSVGRFTGRVSPEKVAALVQSFEQKNYFSLDDRYLYGEASCSPYIADFPGAITSIKLAGRSKRVEHDAGCPNAPVALAEIEKQIDATAETSRWIGRR